MRNFVISRDVESIVERWCRGHELELEPPSSEFFSQMFERLRASFIHAFREEYQFLTKFKKQSMEETLVDAYSYDRVRSYVSKRCALTKGDLAHTFWISMDCIYAPELGREKDADFHIQVTRIFEPDGCERLGIDARPNASGGRRFGAIEDQAEACAEAYRAGGAFSRVYLVDDGLFTGGTLIEIARKLLANGIPLSNIHTALATFKGVDSLNVAIEELNKAGLLKLRQFLPGIVVPGLRDWVCVSNRVQLRPPFRVQ
jgi:hypothetical protein